MLMTLSEFVDRCGYHGCDVMIAEVGKPVRIFTGNNDWDLLEIMGKRYGQMWRGQCAIVHDGKATDAIITASSRKV